jgi:hypothetical protein
VAPNSLRPSYGARRPARAREARYGRQAMAPVENASMDLAGREIRTRGGRVYELMGPPATSPGRLMEIAPRVQAFSDGGHDVSDEGRAPCAGLPRSSPAPAIRPYKALFSVVYVVKSLLNTWLCPQAKLLIPKATCKPSCIQQLFVIATIHEGFQQFIACMGCKGSRVRIPPPRP